jgi:integrase
MSRRPQYLKLRHQTWFFQLHVPPDLRSFLDGEPGYSGGKITKTTGEHDVSQAQHKALRWAGDYHRRFSQLRTAAGGKGFSPRDVYRAKLSSLKESRFEVEGGDPESDYYDPEGEYISQEIDALIDDAKKDKDGEPILDVAATAKLDALNDFAARYRHGKSVPARHEYGMTFSEAAHQFMLDKVRTITKQSQVQYEASQRLFSDSISNKALRLVTSKDAGKFFDALLTLDPNWGRGRGVKAMSFAEIKAKYGGKAKDGLSDRTINRYLCALSPVWKWGKARGEVSGDNPFDGLMRSKKNGATYIHFETEELESIFSTPSKKAHLREIAMVGLYTGARLNEICSLAWENIKEEDGVWYFDIIASKSEAGVRRVPIHSKLLWLVERGRDVSDRTAQVWLGIVPGGPDMKHSWKVSPAFTIHRRDCGIPDFRTAKKKLAYHSFRKNAVRALVLSGVPVATIQQIVGHERGLTMGTYNPEGLTLPILRESVEKITYPGLEPIATKVDAKDETAG